MERPLDAVGRRGGREPPSTVAPRCAQPERFGDHAGACSVRLEARRLCACGSREGRSGTAARRAATARRFASAVRSLVDAAGVLGDGPSIVDESHLPAVSARTSPTSTARIAPPACSIALDDLGLHGERPDEPIEVGDDDDVGLARPRPSRPRDASPAAARAVRRRRRPAPRSPRRARARRARMRAAIRSPLLGRRDERLALAVADAADADDTDGPTHGGTLASHRRISCSGLLA